jgi:hypothetical protein
VKSVGTSGIAGTGGGFDESEVDIDIRTHQIHQASRRLARTPKMVMLASASGLAEMASVKPSTVEGITRCGSKSDNPATTQNVVVMAVVHISSCPKAERQSWQPGDDADPPSGRLKARL